MTNSTVLFLNVTFGQLAIFSSSLQQPLNDWTDRHVAQGFAWRPGSVSFRALVEAGTHEITIEVTEHGKSVKSDVIRAIEVPFDSPADGAVEIASIADSKSLSLPPGSYNLRCEFMRDIAGVYPVRVVFIKGVKQHFAVLRADPGLSLGSELLTTAKPA